MTDLAIRPRPCAVSPNTLLCFVQPREDVDCHQVFEVEGHGAPRRFLETDGNAVIEHRFSRDVILIWGIAPQGRLRLLDLPSGAVRDVLPGSLALCDRLLDKDGARIVFARALAWDEPQAVYEFAFGDERPHVVFRAPVRDVVAVTRDRVFVVTRDLELWEAPRDRASRPRKLADLPTGPSGVTARVSPGGNRLALELERTDGSPLEDRRDLVVLDVDRGERVFERKDLDVTRPYLAGERASLGLRWLDDGHLTFEDAVVRKRDRAEFEADYRRNELDLASGTLATDAELRVSLTGPGGLKTERLAGAPESGAPEPRRVGSFLVEGRPNPTRIRFAATGEVAWEAHDPRVFEETCFSPDGRFAAVMDQHMGQLVLLEGEARATRPVTSEWSHTLSFLPAVKS